MGEDNHERRMSAPQPKSGSPFTLRNRRRPTAGGGAAFRLELAFCAFRQALKDIAADIRNVPANYKRRRLMVDGLRRYARQHYERKRVAGKQEPTRPAGDDRIC